MEKTLGTKLLKMAIFDRDYRSEAEAKKVAEELGKFCWHAAVHERKELENYLLHPIAIGKAIRSRLQERSEIGAKAPAFNENLVELLMGLSEDLKNSVQARLIASRECFEKTSRQGLTG